MGGGFSPPSFQVLASYLSFEYPTLVPYFCSGLSFPHPVIYGCIFPQRAKKLRRLYCPAKTQDLLETQKPSSLSSARR